MNMILEQFPVVELNPPYFEQMLILVQELQKNPHAVLMIESASLHQFSCSQCGECCRLPWTISLTQDYYQQWYSIFDQHPSGRFKEPFTILPEANPDAYADMRRKPKSAECIFLEPDQSCFIHQHYGEAALSSVCKKYPRVIKDIQQLFASRTLLNSCRETPGFNESYGQIFCRKIDLKQLGQSRLIPSFENYPDREIGYLWMAMGLDLLRTQTAASTLARWKEMLVTLEWMDGIGLGKITVEQMQTLYHDLISRLQLLDLKPTSVQNRHKALDWSLNALNDHPGCYQWLKSIQNHQAPWPILNEEERLLLDQQIQIYMSHRLLSMPQPDLFFSNLRFWQQQMILGIQVTMLQWLCLYFRETQQTPLEKEMVYRAVNAVGLRYEQRQKLSHDLQFANLSDQGCLNSLMVLLDLDFASIWNQI